MNKKLINILLVCLALGVLAFSLFLKQKNKPLKELPYYGEQIEDSVLVDGEYQKKIYNHTAGDFSFINQEGKTITQKDLEGKIYVVDYFFTTCKSICPVMTNQMHRIYEVYKNENDVKFLSHTVDPETDSVAVLAAYAKNKNADPNKWYFLTGDKKMLYELARKSYYLDAEEGDGGPDDFIHTPNFALIDKEKHIRGYYDGTDSVQVNTLINDIDMLLKSYK